MTALKRVAPKFLTANGWLMPPVMTRTNSENYQLLSTEKHLLFYCKWHFNWHIGVLGFHHLNSCTRCKEADSETAGLSAGGGRTEPSLSYAEDKLLCHYQKADNHNSKENRITTLPKAKMSCFYFQA